MAARPNVIHLAVGAALAAMAAGIQAQTVITGTQNGAQVWTSGDLTIGPAAAVVAAGDGVSASGPSLGTLTNNGTITTANGMGVVNVGTMTALTNGSTGTIHGSTGIGNVGGIGTLSNDGTIAAVGYGIDNDVAAGPAGTIGVLNNRGVITATGWPSAGIENFVGTIGTLANSGTINGGFQGIHNDRGSIGLLDNSGSIAGGVYGIQSESGTIDTLHNSGTITAANGAIENESAIGTLSNSGVLGDGRGAGAMNLGTIGTVINTGTILGLGNNPGRNGSASTLNAPGPQGTIGVVFNAGMLNDLGNTGSIGIVRNTGTIVGIDNQGGSIGVIDNSGFISGSAEAVFNSGRIGTLANTGTITGGVYALHNGPTGTLSPIANSGKIAGNILNESTSDLTFNGGSGSTFGTLTGFGGAVGTITNTASNVVFGTGNVLLNSGINVGKNAVVNSASTLQVNAPVAITGNYSQGAGATLQVGVGNGAVAAGSLSGDVGYGRLVVSGSAVVAAGSAIALQKTGGYVFAAGQRYVVIDAASGSTNYNAGSLNYSINGYTSVLSGATVATGGRSDLIVTVLSATPAGSPVPGPAPAPAPAPPPTPAPGTPATMPNAISALTGLSHYTGIDDAALLNLYNAGQALNLGSGDAANRAGTQLSPVQHVSATGAAGAAILDVLNITNARSNSLRLGQIERSGIATGEGTLEWSAWGQAFGGHTSQKTRDQVDGYRASYGGLMIGADRALGAAWRAGGVFSYSNTLINGHDNSAGDSTRVNAYGLTGYASYVGKPWYVNISAGVAQQHYDTNREIGFTGFSGIAKGSFGGRQYVARIEGGYPFAVGNATLTPLASLTYSHLKQNDYIESGGNGAALAVGSTHVTSVRSGLGARLERGFETSYGSLVPHVQLQWLHEFNRNAAVTSASFAADPTGQTAFTTVGAAPVSNLADLTLGVTLLRASNLSLSARYELQAGQGFLSHTGSLKLQQLF